MERRDHALLNKQFGRLDQSRAEALLALSILTTILFCVLLGGVSIG
jgi:hypothetical protein